MPKIVFLRIKDNQVKVQRLCGAVQHHYHIGDSIMIAVANEEAGTFVDQLLWRYPQDSFLPHSVSQKEIKSKIVITTKQENLNQAAILINLRPHASAICNQFETVYELFDETHPEKKRLSEQRRLNYQQQGLLPR